MPRLPFPLFPVAFLTAIFYLNFGSRVLLGPFLPVIEQELGLGHGSAGSLFIFIQIGYAAGLLGSGVVSWKLTHRRTIVLSSVGVGLAMIALSRAATLAEMHACLVLLGLAAGLYLPTGIAAITELVEEPHWGKALAVHEWAPNLGFITAPLLAEALLHVMSWRGVLAVVGVVAIALGGCFAGWGQGGARRGEAPHAEAVRRVVREPALWALACLFAMGIGTSFGVYTMLPLYLVSEIDLPRGTANAVTGFSRISSLAMLLVSGWLTDRMGHRRALSLALVLAGATTVGVGLAAGPLLTPTLVFFQSAAAVLFFPPAFAAVSRLFAPQSRNLAVSLVGTVGSLVGGGLLPSAIGHLAEIASFSAAFTLVGVISILSPLLLFVGAHPRDSAQTRRGDT
jgi:NNP family nitrate/nitrite transporter-like MFS transporter